MNFFSRLVFICNLCFLTTILLRFVELYFQHLHIYEALVNHQAVVSTLVVLAYSSILLNFIFLLFALGFSIFKKPVYMKKWILFSNVIFFFLQLAFFFL